jgi:oxygen-independent coproporphyrinogen-3 oxidase
VRRCDYCDFFVAVGRDADHERYVERMEREIHERAAALPEADRLADTIYLGGGTPSRLDPPRVGRLVAACRAAFDVAPEPEVTLEANPEGIDARSLEGWLRAGINRLSVGVQSTSDATLRRRGRLHTGRGAVAALRLARAAGFRNVGADLIAGLPPGETGAGASTVEETAAAVGEVLGAEPDHVSLYLLETDKEAPLMLAAREGRVSLPSDDEAAEAFERGRDLLVAAGYEHYEISSFCRPGRRSRHNLKYWRGEPVLGFGPSAFSLHGGRLEATSRDLDAFLEGSAAPEDHSAGSRDAAAREALVLELRLLEGVDLEAFDRRRGTSLRLSVPGEVADLAEAGVVRLRGSRLGLTPRGVLLANELFSRIARHG